MNGIHEFVNDLEKLIRAVIEDVDTHSTDPNKQTIKSKVERAKNELRNNYVIRFQTDEE